MIDTVTLRTLGNANPPRSQEELALACLEAANTIDELAEHNDALIKLCAKTLELKEQGGD